jgi:hypothetical protein
MYDWSFQSPVEPVWGLIAGPENWADWWPAVKQVRLLAAGDTDGLDAECRIAWRTPLPIVTLRLDSRTTRVERHRAVQSVTIGNYSIEESWYFFPRPGGTDVRHSWMIRFTHRWMRLIPRFERRVLRAYCDAMALGPEGARARLGES